MPKLINYGWNTPISNTRFDLCILHIPAAKKKDRKKSKKKADLGSDSDSDIDPLKQNVKNAEENDLGSEDEMIVASMKSKSKKDKKKKTGFAALAVEDSDEGRVKTEFSLYGSRWSISFLEGFPTERVGS